jgi:hypothetical protein
VQTAWDDRFEADQAASSERKRTTMQARQTSRGKRRAILVSLGMPMMIGTLLWSTGLASAHGGDTSQVHACVVPASGTIRIIEPGASCRENETALDWTRNAGAAYSAGFGLDLSAANEFSVTGAPWDGLTGVPAGFADNDDDDGSLLVNELRSDLSTYGSGVIDGGSIKPGTIRTVQLAGKDFDDPSTPAEDDRAPGAVTSEKIADGAIDARDLSSALLQRIEALEARVAALEAE